MLGYGEVDQRTISNWVDLSKNGKSAEISKPSDLKLYSIWNFPKLAESKAEDLRRACMVSVEILQPQRAATDCARRVGQPRSLAWTWDRLDLCGYIFFFGSIFIHEAFKIRLRQDLSKGEGLIPPRVRSWSPSCPGRGQASPKGSSSQG